MISSPEQPQPILREQAQASIRRVFEDISLKRYIPTSTAQPKIALLGAGSAVEGKPLSDYFVVSGLPKPKIIAFDISSKEKLLAEATDGARIDLDYRLADASDSRSFRDEKYDLVVIRRPAVHKFQPTWEQILKNGINHLNPNGSLIITASEPGEVTFVEQHLKPEEIVLEYNIPEEDAVLMLFDEYKLFVVQPKSA